MRKTLWVLCIIVVLLSTKVSSIILMEPSVCVFGGRDTILAKGVTDSVISVGFPRTFEEAEKWFDSIHQISLVL